MRRLPIVAGGLVLVAALLLAAAGDRASAQSEPVVDVIKVSGYLDPVLVEFIEASLETAERERSVVLVLQVDSPGAVVTDRTLDVLVDRLETTAVTVGVWVGPSGSKAEDEAGRLVDAADHVGVAPGSSVQLSTGVRVGADEALDQGVADFPAPTVGDFIVRLPGVETREVDVGGEPRLEPVTPVRFAGLTLLDQLFHTVASPAVAYLLFVIGMALILFELYTAGIGVAGVVGAGFFILGCYGLAVLPARGVGVGLLLLAMFGFAVDVQTGVPRVWTGIATVAFVLGSLLLYDGVELSWITQLLAVVGMTVAMITGMPAMVRSRFSTPTIGREWMIGEVGTALGEVAPDGLVSVREAPWRARTNRATPIPAGAPVRVAAIEGLVLEVEPLEGAARDYREARPRHSQST